jgi:hypothetical protein
MSKEELTTDLLNQSFMRHGSLPIKDPHTWGKLSIFMLRLDEE